MPDMRAKMAWVEDLMTKIHFSINMEVLKDYCSVRDVESRGLRSMSLGCGVLQVRLCLLFQMSLRTNKSFQADFTPDLAQRCKKSMLRVSPIPAARGNTDWLGTRCQC